MQPRTTDRRQLTLSSAIYSPPRPSLALFESSLPPSVRPQSSRPEGGAGLHRKGILILGLGLVKVTSVDFTQQFELLSFVERPRVGSTNVLSLFIISLDLGGVGLLWKLIMVCHQEGEEDREDRSKIVNGRTGDYSNVIVAEEENNHWLPPTYSAR